MPIGFLREFFFWCGVVNYGVLVCWFIALLIARAGLYRLHAKWFQLSPAQFDAINYSAMAAYKIGILLLNVAPYIAVRVLLSHVS
jgi:hypothetical protein